MTLVLILQNKLKLFIVQKPLFEFLLIFPNLFLINFESVFIKTMIKILISYLWILPRFLQIFLIKIKIINVWYIKLFIAINVNGQFFFVFRNIFLFFFPCLSFSLILDLLKQLMRSYLSRFLRYLNLGLNLFLLLLLLVNWLLYFLVAGRIW